MINREVVFSKIAQERLEALLNYLETEWSLLVKKKFIIKLDECFNQINVFPNSNQYSKTLNLNRCKVTKHTTFYYSFTDDEIYVSFFIDSRMKNIDK